MPRSNEADEADRNVGYFKYIRETRYILITIYTTAKYGYRN